MFSIAIFGKGCSFMHKSKTTEELFYFLLIFLMSLTALVLTVIMVSKIYYWIKLPSLLMGDQSQTTCTSNWCLHSN